MTLDVGQGMRCAWRTLSSEPSFTLIAVTTLALGVGSSTGIFMVANGALLRPLPYPDAERLVIIQAEFDSYGAARLPLSPPELIDIREQTESLHQLEAIWCSGGSLTSDGDPEQIDVGFVTAGFLPVLGIPPAHGRGFTREEDLRGGPQAIVLSDGPSSLGPAGGGTLKLFLMIFLGILALNALVIVGVACILLIDYIKANRNRSEA